ncbi:MAG: hypothetical protein Q7U68_01685 [Candidatus Roizmanbacteria bacterium]|nr:hypothetical protein [Candidatus Roizmanbacteria bacterium]
MPHLPFWPRTLRGSLGPPAGGLTPRIEGQFADPPIGGNYPSNPEIKTKKIPKLKATTFGRHFLLGYQQNQSQQKLFSYAP